MADGNLPKQDFAPPWLKFPQENSSKASGQKGGYQGDRNRQRREDNYHPRPDYNRLHRQQSFDYHEPKRFPSGQGKYRHHSVDDDYYGYGCGYGYGYPPDYGYEKFGMQYASQPSLGRRDGKYFSGRFPPGADFSPHYEMYEPSYHPNMPRRGYYDNHMNGRDYDGKGRDRGHPRDRPFSDDFPSLVGKGEHDVKRSKPVAGAWENPPKSNRTSEESSDQKPSPGIYKALVPSKNGPAKKNGRMNGTVRDSSPLSPSNKLNNHKEGSVQSPTADLAIVTQPKKLGDQKKSQFLRALRNESTVRNGESGQDVNQNAVEKKQDRGEESSVKHKGVNGNCVETAEEKDNCTSKTEKNAGNSLNKECGSTTDSLVAEEKKVNGESLVDDVDHINLSVQEEEMRLLKSMGWEEEDNTEYVITEDEIREFQSKLQNHCNGQKNGLKTTLRNALSLKLDNDISNGIVNGHDEKAGKDSL